MTTDTAILLLLADLQTQIVALRAEVQRLTLPLDAPTREEMS